VIRPPGKRAISAPRDQQRRGYDGRVPELTFDLHAWPGYHVAAVATAVRHAATSAGGGAGRGAVRVTAKSPFAARVSVGVTANVSGVVARAVEAALERLRDPGQPRTAA
jgi:hypothetical protein